MENNIYIYIIYIYIIIILYIYINIFYIYNIIYLYIYTYIIYIYIYVSLFSTIHPSTEQGYVVSLEGRKSDEGRNGGLKRGVPSFRFLDDIIVDERTLFG